MIDYSDYKWIKVKSFKFDKTKSWEENYKELEKHHVEETTFLIEEVRRLAAKLNKSPCDHAEQPNQQSARQGLESA